MDELLTDGFRELSQDEKEVIDGGGVGGAAIGLTVGIGYGNKFKVFKVTIRNKKKLK